MDPVNQRAPNPPEFAQPRLSRVKARSSPTRGHKFGCVCSYMAGHEDAGVVTGHIGTNTPKFVRPRWGRPRFDPTQTGLRKFGWVWIGRTPKGTYSSRGRSSGNCLLRTPSENPSQNPFYCENQSRAPSQNPFWEPLPQNPSQNAVLPYDPLGVHPIGARWVKKQVLHEST